MDAPLVLAFDTAASHCDAALLRGSEILAHHHEEMTKGQAERLVGLLTEVLAAASCDFRNLDAIGVGTGPGNFTGIRIAISTARGLALGLNVPAVGVSLFDALREGRRGPCACAIDARRGQIYLQQFSADGTAQTPRLCDANDLPPLSGELIGTGGLAPLFPPAVAIARIASGRLSGPNPRPTPLYLRPADAAPAKDQAPGIFT